MAPYNPTLDGLAESGVKITKSILIKCLEKGKDVQRALYERRNAPRVHRYSPAQLMLCRSQNILLPLPAKVFAPIDLEAAAAAKDKAVGEQAAAYNWDKTELKQLLPNKSVRVQCEKTSSRERIGMVVEKLSYLGDVQGKMLVRAR